MENSIAEEVKAKVFALYLGQTCIDSDNKKHHILGISLEEAMIQVDGDNHDVDWWNFDAVKLILKPLSSITDEDAIECGWKQIMSLKEFADAKSVRPLEVYQRLINKGYDLPQYLLGGKTLKETGLAIY